MSQQPSVCQRQSQTQISRYFKAVTRSNTTTMSTPSWASKSATTSTILPLHPTATKSVKLEHLFPLKAIAKTAPKPVNLRQALSVKVKCAVKVDKEADKWYPKPDVVMTVDRIMREARRIKKDDNTAVIRMKEVYPWLWWQCLYEGSLSKSKYYEIRGLHTQVCRCCENARWTPEFHVSSSSSLCNECEKECLIPNQMWSVCPKLRTLQDQRKLRMKEQSRRIKVITTEEVIAQKLRI